jgi:hypothetical protein
LRSLRSRPRPFESTRHTYISYLLAVGARPLFGLTKEKAPLDGAFVESGRPGSNRRRPAWEAGILPLNYARVGLSIAERGNRDNLATPLLAPVDGRRDATAETQQASYVRADRRARYVSFTCFPRFSIIGIMIFRRAGKR